MQQLFTYLYLFLLFIILIISTSICLNKPYIQENFGFSLKNKVKDKIKDKKKDIKDKIDIKKPDVGNIKDKIASERKNIQDKAKNKLKGQPIKYDKHYNEIKGGVGNKINEKRSKIKQKIKNSFNKKSFNKKSSTGKSFTGKSSTEKPSTEKPSMKVPLTNKKHINNSEENNDKTKEQYNISFADDQICLQYNESDILNQRISTIQCANAFKENNLFSLDEQHFITPNSDPNMCLSYTDPNMSVDPNTLRVTFMPKDDGYCISSQNSPSNNNVIKADCLVNDEQKDCMMFSKKYLQDQDVDHDIYYTYSSNDSSLVPAEWKLV